MNWHSQDQHTGMQPLHAWIDWQRVPVACVCWSYRCLSPGHWHFPKSIPRRFFGGKPLDWGAPKRASDMSRASAQVPAEGTAACISETLVLI